MDPNTQRAEAERWLGIAAKLLTARDFLGSKTFAIRARESDPNNPISEQILAVVETVLGGEKRVSSAAQQQDWYAVLQLPRLVRDPELIASHYRRLAHLLNPELNRLPFADYALQLANEAWSVLSDPTKKWMFDNELAMSLQRESESTRVGPDNPDVGNSGTAQLNTFQFFQPQVPSWQQQNQREFMPSSQQQSQREFMPLNQQQNQREFMSPPPPQAQPQQLPPRWQMRDFTPAKGGERNKHGGTGEVPPTPFTITSAPTIRMDPPAPPPAPAPAPAQASSQPPPAVQAPAGAGVGAGAPAPAVDGNTINRTNNNSDKGRSSNKDNNAGAGVGASAGANANANANANESNDDVVEEVESFWTACPYCFYTYEYQRIYKDCTLRCQNCRRGFQAVQIPNPPSIDPAKGRGKDKEFSFCCWGFFPLGFSMTAWNKHKEVGNSKGSLNWVPFSPMFACPTESGGGNFQWFASSGDAFVGPKNVNVRRKSVVRNTSASRIYADDDDDEDYVVASEPSSDSSDHDWQDTRKDKSKHKKGKIRGRKRGRPRKKDRVNHGTRNSFVEAGALGGGGETFENGSASQVVKKRGRPRKVHMLNQGNQNSLVEDGVSGGGENLEVESGTQVVIGLIAGAKADNSKNVVSTVRKQTRRRAKHMGKLDLNVEFNNVAEEHAPTVSAVNEEEDGIENIGFFEGLDEFFSTLPILNVSSDEKAKPS